MITILSVPRTASTYYAQFLSEQHGYENLKELFGQPWLTSEDLNNGIKLLNTKPKAVVKAFPFHIDDIYFNYQPRVPGILDALINNADRIIFLIRKDFYGQCKSFYQACYTNHWISDAKPHQVIPLDITLYNTYAKTLEFCYNKLYEYSKLCTNYEIVYTEEIENEFKYIKPVTWEREPPVPDFDPLTLFKR